MEKRYDPKQNEAAMQAFWAQEDIYRFQPEHPGELFAIDTPPPTVSGSLHIGHIFSYTQAELIARFRRMRGYNVFYPFGFDDNGLPTERLAEKELGIHAKDLPREEFSQHCDAIAQKYESRFQLLWQSLGFSVDWSQLYRSNSTQTRRIAQRSFLQLVKQGTAYYQQAPVLWCPHCTTSIAQAELETQEQPCEYLYIPFAVDGCAPLTIATTRPELLFGCVCVFVHPQDKRFFAYHGKQARVPLYEHSIPILTDALVSMEQGSGAVMCATFGDSCDAHWYATHKLPYRRVILPDGTLDAAIPYAGGLSVQKAQLAIRQRLLESGLLLKTQATHHQVAVHERCGNAMEILPSGQWYIDLLRHKSHWLTAADEIRWHPPHMKARYLAWVENLKWDWCISRQRYYGVPIPVWYCTDCKRPAFADEDTLPLDPAKTSYNGRCACGCTHFIPETAVLDTWATSSLTPQINARYGEENERNQLLPMALRTQAHEIIRTWAFYTIVRSFYDNGQLPWKEVMISGFVLAKPGEKLSKSKNNAAISPQALIAAHSADALRYWAASAKLGTDTYFEQDALTVSKRFLTKLWNAAKFTSPHLKQYTTNSADTVLLPTDLWILARLDETMLRANELLMEYEIGAARHEIDSFFWQDFCDFYIELVKERLYSPEKQGNAAFQSAVYTLYHTLFRLLQLYASYVPHITECIYQECYRGTMAVPSLHLTQWQLPAAPDTAILEFGTLLCTAVTQARKYKTEHNLSHKAEIPMLTLTAPSACQKWAAQSMGDLASCTGAKEICIIYPS